MRLDCCHCQGIESTFDEKGARSSLRRYYRKGPKKTAQLLIDFLAKDGLQDQTLLDIGGGVGIIQLEMFKHGLAKAVSIEGSSGYLKIAKREAERQGTAQKVTTRHGNFVEIAPELEPADLVTLDRVICCYDDMPSLVSSSVSLAKKYYGVVFPRDTWFAKAAIKVGNFFFWLSGNPFRIFVHPTEGVEKLVAAEGLKRVFYKRKGFWQVIVYAR